MVVHFLPYDGDNIGVITITGQGPVIVPKDEFGPTKFPLRVPPAMIVFTTPQGNPLILTVAILLVIEAIPTHIQYINYVHVEWQAKTTSMCVYQ